MGAAMDARGVRAARMEGCVHVLVRTSEAITAGEVAEKFGVACR